MSSPQPIAVVGVSGYTGFELAKLLLRHPAGSGATFFMRDTQGAHCLSELFPQLRGTNHAQVRQLSIDNILAIGAKTAFLATPHEASAELAPQLLEAGLKVIDLSGAFRFRDAAVFQSWYKLPAPHAAWLSSAVYGLPEFYSGELATAQLVANPGCYATSVILAVRPLVQAGLLDSNATVIADCKSGATGAGKELRRDLHFSELDENFKAYNLFSHRQTPEIVEQTGLAESQLTFTTHLLPIARGILSTIYITLAEPQPPESIEALYRKTYAGRPIVRIWKSGALPEIQHVANTNFADIGFTLDRSGRRLIVVSCLDNLGKGAAGQAIQNFNHLLNLEENTGLV